MECIVRSVYGVHGLGTKGKTTEFINKLKNKGARTVNSIKELLDVINDLEIKNNN